MTESLLIPVDEADPIVTRAETLPAAIEEALCSLQYDDECPESSVTKLRELLLSFTGWTDAPTQLCPDCKGFGIVRSQSGNFEEGCEPCGGNGFIKLNE